MKTLKILCFLSLCLYMVSCGGDSCENINTDVQTAINDFSDALTAFSTNPTDENCEIFREEYADYIDALKGFQDCSNQINSVDLNELIQEAEQDLEDFEC